MAVGVIVHAVLLISSILTAKENVYVLESEYQKLSAELAGKLEESFVLQTGIEPKPLADSEWKHLIVLSSNMPCNLQFHLLFIRCIIWDGV